MGLKVKEKVIGLDCFAGEKSTQAVFHGSIELPAGRLVWLKGRPTIGKVQLAEDKVTIEGTLDLQLVYEPAGEKEGETSLELAQVQVKEAISFHHTMDIIGADTGMRPVVKVDVLNLETLSRASPTSAEVEALLVFDLHLMQEKTVTLVTGASVQPPKKLIVDAFNLQARHFIGQEQVNVTLKNEVDLPEGLEPIKRILDMQVIPKYTRVDVTPDTVETSGQCDLKVIYYSGEGAVRSFSWDNCFQLRKTIDTKDYQYGPNVETVATIDLQPEWVLSQEGMSLAVTAVGELWVELAEPVETPVVLGLSSPDQSGVASRTKSVHLDNRIGRKTQSASVQGVIELNEDQDPVREVVAVNGKVRVTDQHIEEDKVHVEGSISLELVYLAHDESGAKPLRCHTFADVAPFQQSAAIGGAQPGMKSLIDVEITDVVTDVINRQAVEASVSLKLDVCVIQSREDEVVVEAIEVCPPDPDPPSITYVVVQPSDTLWKLSKMYHTDMEAIMQANSWLDEQENLQPQVKLCIPRNRPQEG